MTRYFCDGCGLEIKDSANNSEFEFGRIRVRALVSVDNVGNGGHVCVACVRKTVAAGAVFNQFGVKEVVEEAEGEGEGW